MRDEARSGTRLVDDERGCGEVRARLLARGRLLELLQQAQHRAPVGVLPVVGGDVALEQLGDDHSYCSASSTLSRDARSAGKIAARIPTITVSTPKMISEPTGSVKTMKSTRAT